MNVLDKATTVAETKYVHDKLQGEIDIIAGIVKVESWADVQKIVRAGMASKIFSIGDQLTCQRDGVNLVWDVIGIDHDTPADPQFTHSLTLQLHDCFPTILQFDAPEAFYYAASSLAAGTYNFTFSGTSYQFTLANTVSAGGQLILAFTGNTPSSVTVASTKGGAAEGTSVSVSQGSGGTSLGELTDAGNFSNNINSLQRAQNGSNNYKESAIRQWLNSSAAAGSVWTPQTDFDRPPSWASTTDGFMHGMDADFLTVIGRTHIVTARNTVCDGGGYDETDDFFFLPSGKEVYFKDNPAEGAVYPYYSDFSDLSSPSGSADTNRVKNKGTAAAAAVWWLRTQIKNTAYQVFRVMDDGRLSSDTALKNYYTAPVCNII